MTPPVPEDATLLRAQIAAAAARLIADDGADYLTAKRKAARQILGTTQPPAHQLPDNAQVEAELRSYQALFQAHTQPARLLRLRTLAVDIMQGLSDFNPYLTGAVLNGTAGAHDDIHLQLFADSPKDVEIFLLNKNVQIDLSESPHFKGPRHDPVETVSFLWQGEGVHAELYEMDDLRGAVKARGDKLQRADLAAVRALLVNTHPESDHE
ncbi:MAG: hypothetical protein ABW069_09745 [Duganella sp.]